MAVLPTGIGPVTGYNIERSLRFNSADSAYLSRTPASNGNRQTWTLSFWLKLGTLSTNRSFFGAGTNGSNYFLFYLTSGDVIRCEEIVGGAATWNVVTTPVYRDPSAWYHIVMAFDSPQATSSNRIKLYVNGVQVTAFSTATYPTQNLNSSYWNATSSHNIGAAIAAGVAYGNGYLTEVNFIDGQALTPSSFGETDSNTGVWKPKAYTGTYGTNGFYLKFADNSGTTSTTLGKDSSGNGNNWTPNNFSVTAGAGNDSLVDTPTNYGTDTGIGGSVRGNYCTVNPLDANANVTLSNGNLDIATGSSYGGCRGTIAVSSGKWYWEVTPTSLTGGASIGIWDTSEAIGTNNVGATAKSYAYWNNGQKQNNNTNSAYGASYTTNDVIGVALDLDAGTLVFYKNNSSQGTAFSSLSGNFAPGFGDTAAASSSNLVVNFGQRAFAYTAPSGFKALCTQNLPTPTIGATSTTQADNYFGVALYSGTGSGNSNVVSGLEFTTDLWWQKARNAANNNYLQDAVRGFGASKSLTSNSTGSEGFNGTPLTQSLSVSSTGFTVSGSDFNGNTASETYVAWCWNAGGSNATNTAGTITSTVRANTTSGFSIVTYTGNGSANQTVGHGLGVAPAFGILKDRDPNSNNDQWQVFHTGAGDKYGYLSTTAAFAGTAEFYPTSGSSTTVTIARGSPAATTNESGDRYVMYLFAPVAGYSAFGSYTGNASADGPFIYTGFRPEFVMIKCSSTTGDWVMQDVARSPYNVSTNYLVANASTAEQTGQLLDFVSNGFKIRVAVSGAMNSSGATYIFMAFAENPFKYSLAR